MKKLLLCLGSSLMFISSAAAGSSFLCSGVDSKDCLKLQGFVNAVENKITITGDVAYKLYYDAITHGQREETTNDGRVTFRKVEFNGWICEAYEAHYLSERLMFLVARGIFDSVDGNTMCYRSLYN